MPKREDLEEALTSVAQNRTGSSPSERMIREIPLQEGYELAFFTLRRLEDGQLQSFMVPASSNDEHVQAVPIPSKDNNGPSYHNHTPTQQNFNIAIREGGENIPRQDRIEREPSVVTVLRRAHARSDGYSVVCGVYSPEISAPVRSENRGKGDFYCPRCGSNYTRPYSVKDHFYYCISKHGNPQALRFTDHPSMAQTEAAIQRRIQASRQPSAGMFQEMSEALYVDWAHENP